MVKSTTPTMEIKKEGVVLANSDTLLANLLNRYPQYFDSLVKNKEQWRIQIIYTQVDRGLNNVPILTHHYYDVNPGRYFYPASTVKLPGAIMALQRLNELKIAGLNKSSTMITEAVTPGQTSVFNDPTSTDGRPTIQQYIKKIFLVSDNDAYNRLYEFLGQEYLNNTLHKLGYDSVQLLHRLQITLTEEQNRTTNPIKFYNAASQIIYQQPLSKSNLVYQSRNTFLGKGYMNGDRLIGQPFDFSKKNRISLPDLHSILQSIIFPESVPAKRRFNLSDDDYRFLYKYMSMKPGESSSPQFDTSYTDAYGKFLMFGGNGPIANPALRIFNKIGDAYGFLNDVAYVVDFDKGVEFMLSATIYCNSDGIFNDDKYDYATVGYPFMKHLGEVMYNYELQRHRTQKPDLSKFKLDYSQ
ncbi:MAG: class A beta-lactamase-related serine hydrolase [Bacteroidota bacterium]|nr:class A beta-lactamase-related serine hydrolase [Bacteroidota bacterium]